MGFFIVMWQRVQVFECLTQFDWPWVPMQWVIRMNQNFRENYTIIRVFRALDWLSSMSGTEVMAQKPRCAQILKKCRSLSLPLAACADSDNSPPGGEHDSELLKPSKNAWSLVACTEKKTFEISVCGFRWASSRWGSVLLFLFFMASSPRQWAEIVAQSLVRFYPGIWIFRALDLFLSVSRANVMAKRPEILCKSSRKIVGKFS